MSQLQRYITTPIFYVNDRPHIGHTYTAIVCDVWARFMRFAGHDVFFLTGTDEHGVKIPKAAAERGIPPQQLVDENAAQFLAILPFIGVTNDDFIRTTQPRHVRQVQAFVQRLLERGHVYLGEFEGWYDEGQEEYVTDNRAKELDYKSPVNRKPLVRAREKNYYFRLSAFQQPLEDLFARQPGFVRPDARRNEVLGRLREGLQDVPISRTNFTWGVPMRDDPQHVIYVWIDALLNYITALGLAEPESSEFKGRGKYWPATYHVIGKEILWFHAVIWPALLLALDLPLPQCVYAHSFWIRDGQKMSKTLGNFIDLETIQGFVERYGLDAWRYYMVTQGPLGATDANFGDAHFHEIYTTDLVNTLGNCASRVTAMIGKYFDGALPPAHPEPSRLQKGSDPFLVEGFDWPALCGAAAAAARAAYEEFDLAGAAAAAMGLVRRVDAFVNATEPFKLAKDESKRDQLGAILYQCAETLRIAALLLWPVLPGRIHELWKALDYHLDPNRGELDHALAWGRLIAGAPIRKVALFPRLEAQPQVAAAPA